MERPGRRPAGAALAGPVFVAVSIGIARILELAGVPERGLQTVLLLLGAVARRPGRTWARQRLWLARPRAWREWYDEEASRSG